MPPGIYRLPLELVREIAAESSSRDLAAFALTARHFHAWVNPYLYEHNIQHQNARAAVWAAARGRLDTLLLLQQAETQSSKPFINKVWRGRSRYGPLLPIEPPQSPLQFTLLHLAAQGGHDDVVSWLLQQGADADAYSTRLCECDLRRQQTPSWSPLHVAICHSQEESARLLLTNNASLQMSHHDGIEALHTAAAKGLSSTIRHLSELPDFDPDVTDSRGRVPLHHAINVPKGLDAIETLLEVGANLQVVGYVGSYSCTPLMSAITQGDLEAAVMLLQAGAKPFPHTDNDRKIAPFRKQLRDRQRVRGSLLSATLRQQGTTGNTGRHEVLQRKVIRALLDFGCDINDSYSIYIDPPLTTAVRNSSSATVRLLLERGAEAEFKAKNGRMSALWYAISERCSASLPERVAKVTALLEHGADLLHHSIICELIVRRSSRAMLDAVADTLGPQNLTDSHRIPRALAICCIFQERKLYDNIMRYAPARARATEDDILYALQEAAKTKRACVPASLDDIHRVLDEIRPGLTVDGLLNQWREEMSARLVEWLEEMSGRETGD